MVEGEPLEATIEVRRGPLGLPGAEVVDPLAGPRWCSGYRCRRFAGDGRRRRVVTRFSRRGLRQLGAPSLRVHDPLALARVKRPGAGPAQELLVLPFTEPVRWRSGRCTGALEGTRTEALAAVDVDGLRPYRAGDAGQRIHWSSLARGAGLLERRLRRCRHAPPGGARCARRGA